jgi:hypothetical protein
MNHAMLKVVDKIQAPNELKQAVTKFYQQVPILRTLRTFCSRFASFQLDTVRMSHPINQQRAAQSRRQV